MEPDPNDRAAEEGEEVGYGKPPRRTRFQPGNVPHNKRPMKPIESLGDVLQQVLSEPRKVTKDGKLQEMTRVERAMRLDVERAANGDTRAIKRLVKLMLKHPKLARSYRQELRVVISGIDASA